MPETKNCPDCEQTIGETETNCPKCGCDLEVINEETIAHFDRLQKIANKRKPQPAPAPAPAPVVKPVEPKSKGGLFGSLAKKR